MKKRRASSIGLCSLFFVLFFSFQSTAAAIIASELVQRHKKWLEQEVVYIITPKEKEVFLALESEKERDVFIEAFWKVRDPTQGTLENEFRKEHYRRIDYANNWYGKDSPGAGWRSDMGRIYIILGEPNSVEKHENLPEIFPFIVWFYDGMMEYGLPTAFNVAFFKRGGMGDYELYSPIKFGPQSLLVQFRGDLTNIEDAYYKLFDIDPTIAQLSLSLIPGESRISISPSIASEILISDKIPSAPRKKVSDTYAENLLKYKDIIEVDYTANFIGCQASLYVLQDKTGLFFVHYLIEPERLTFEQYQSRYLSNLEINGTVSDTENKIIYQFERTLPIEFNQSQIDNIQNKLFSFQDMFPMAPGSYRMNILLKNTVSKEFTSFEAALQIPEISSPQIGSLILGNRLYDNSRYAKQNKPFLFNSLQLLPSPRNDFTRQDTIYLYFQLFGLSPEIRESGILEYSIWNENEKIYAREREVNVYPDPRNIMEEIALAEFPAAYYRLRITLFDRDRKQVNSRQENVILSSAAQLPRPWVMSLPMPASQDPMFSNILGKQYYQMNNPDQAALLLEEAYRKSPENPGFALDLCRILLIKKEYLKLKQIAAPFMNDDRKSQFLQIMGETSQNLGEYNNAIAYYVGYLDTFGTNINVLNSIGECYQKAGNLEEALTAWERSLELEPNQEKLRALVNSIKEKK